VLRVGPERFKIRPAMLPLIRAVYVLSYNPYTCDVQFLSQHTLPFQLGTQSAELASTTISRIQGLSAMKQERLTNVVSNRRYDDTVFTLAPVSMAQ
jgi:hypothetical protein